MILSYKWYNKLAVFYLVFAAILQTYGYGGFLNFARFLSILLIPIVAIKLISTNNTLRNVPKPINVYFYWLFFVAFVSATSLSDVLPLGQIEKYLVLLAVFCLCNFNKFISLYKKIAYLSVIFLIIQKLVLITTGLKISGIAEFLPLDMGEEIDASLFYDYFIGETSRLSSFFSEPALFVQYVLPLLVIELFSAKKFKDWLKVGLIFISILWTESGNGLLVLIIVFISYIIHYIISGGTLKIIIVPVILAGALMFGQRYINTESGEKLLERQTELDSGIEASSGFVRILRGYYVYDEYSPLEKLIGINNLSKQVEKINTCKAAHTFGEGDYYANTFQKFLLNTGLIGAILFFVIMVYLFRNNTPVGRTIVLVYTGLSFIAASYLGPIMFMYLYMANGCKHQSISYA